MKQQLKNLVERVLIARPDASISDLRNLVPQLRDRRDEEIAKLVEPMRNQHAKGRK